MPSSSDPPSTASPVHSVLHGLVTGFGQTASQHPWFVVLVALMVLPGLVRAARISIHSGPRDSLRRFTRGDKNLLLLRAGHRCEHHDVFGHRCVSTERLEADHVHPWSRGGWTNLANGQILCRTHNRAKNAAIPWNRTLRKLAERRVGYYPPSVDGDIVRRPTRALRPAA